MLVTNQHSLSDAEDFTEGYRAMGLGKVVGEPTAGWIIYHVEYAPAGRDDPEAAARTDYQSQWCADGDASTARRYQVTRAIGEATVRSDAQLDKAVETLLAALK